MLAGFRWVIAGRLAGSGRPGLLSDPREDLLRLTSMGFRTIVTLTEDPLEPDPEAFGMRAIHFPVTDMGIPSPRAATELCQQVLHLSEVDGPVLLHCKAGLGRTGTLLACCLVELGRSAEQAILEVRKINPAYIQSTIQERFIGHYETHRRADRGREVS